MNWPELYKQYPLAYKYMEDNFKCLYRFKHPDYSIKHPLNRDLYDFFDEAGVIVQIYQCIETRHFKFSILHSHAFEVDLDRFEYRKSAETEAFTKAFEMLNERLLNV